MKSGDTINCMFDDGRSAVAVVRTEWFHGEHPPRRDRQPGVPWRDLTVIETERGAFLVRGRSRNRENGHAGGGVQRVRTIGVQWRQFDGRDMAIDWLAERSRDGEPLAGKALARLQAEEV